MITLTVKDLEALEAKHTELKAYLRDSCERRWDIAIGIHPDIKSKEFENALKTGRDASRIEDERTSNQLKLLERVIREARRQIQMDEDIKDALWLACN